MALPNGIIIPIATPLTSAGNLDEPALRQLIRAQAPHADGIFALGSSGECAWLPADIARRVRHVARDETDGRVSLYLGIGETSMPRTLANLAELTAADAEFTVVTSPYYYPIEQEALVGYFEQVADSSPVPVVLYNIPQNTGLVISTDSLRRLAAHGNIVGIKDSSGDMLGFMRMLALQSPTFAVLQGREQLLAASFEMGAQGIVSALGNIAPALLRATIDATLAGDRDQARAFQTDVSALAELFDQGYWVAALKNALNQLGFPVGQPVPPMPATTKAQAQEIATILTSTKPEWLLKDVN